jgi:hypothetical protein
MRRMAISMSGNAPGAARRLQQVHGAGGIAGNRGQRLVQFVAHQRGHLADRRQPRRGLQPLLAGARKFLHAALLADVQEGAHPAGLQAHRG